MIATMALLLVAGLLAESHLGFSVLKYLFFSHRLPSSAFSGDWCCDSGPKRNSDDRLSNGLRRHRPPDRISVRFSDTFYRGR